MVHADPAAWGRFLRRTSPVEYALVRRRVAEGVRCPHDHLQVGVVAGQHDGYVPLVRGDAAQVASVPCPFCRARVHHYCRRCHAKYTGEGFGPGGLEDTGGMCGDCAWGSVGT
jgi:hypothetical protein